MNPLLKSFLYAMASAALTWLRQLDEADTIMDWLESEIDKLREE